MLYNFKNNKGQVIKRQIINGVLVLLLNNKQIHKIL